MDATEVERSAPAEPASVGAAKPASVALRTFLGAVLIGTVGLLMGVDAAWKAGFVYAACGAAVVALATGEYTDLAVVQGARVSRGFLVLCAVALFLLQWAGWAAPSRFPGPWLWAAAMPAVVVMAVLSGRVLRQEIPGALEAAGAAVLGLAYIPLLLGFLTAVRIQWGLTGIIAVLAVCKGGSSGAYFLGTALGRRKLAPLVSPRKTIAGALGAIAASVAVSYGLACSPWAMMSPTPAIFYGLCVSTAAILGDLVASLLKREAGVKDSGRLLPGFGGMLDMVDDILFAAPVSYFFFQGCALFHWGG